MGGSKLSCKESLELDLVWLKTAEESSSLSESEESDELNVYSEDDEDDETGFFR